jgi:hypothetical protein
VRAWLSWRCGRADAFLLLRRLVLARAVKRSWHEETVFKHQSRGEPAAKKRFVNDTIRSDFHRRFLNRYIK